MQLHPPILEYVQRTKIDSSRNVVTVFPPKYVVGRCWEQFLQTPKGPTSEG